MKKRSLIIQLARVIHFVVALNKHIKNVMEIIATDSNKVSIMSGNYVMEIITTDSNKVSIMSGNHVMEIITTDSNKVSIMSGN